MKHSYLYIEAEREIDETSKFFRVWVGTSHQANRDYLFLLAYATNNNYFLQSTSSVTDEYLLNIAKSLPNFESRFPLENLNLQHVQIRDLVRAIKGNEAIKRNAQTKNFSSAQREMLDSAYYSFKKLARNLTLPSGTTY